MKSNAKTINLLPKEAQKQLRLRAWFSGLVRLYVLAGLGFLALGLVWVLVWSYLGLTSGSLQSETEKLQEEAARPEHAQTKETIRIANNQIADYNKLAKGIPQWSRLVRTFATVVPPGVEVQSFVVDITKKQVSITGFASSRDGVIALYNNIVAEPNFKDVNYPLENVSRPRDVNFTFAFTVKDELLAQ